MAYGKIASVSEYKGHRIETVEDPAQIQILFVVDGDTEHAYWSMADAKRAINGKCLKFYAVDIQSWFR